MQHLMNILTPSRYVHMLRPKLLPFPLHEPASLTFLHKQDMHRRVRDDDERCCEDTKSDDVRPQSTVVESKCAQDRGPRDFDIETVFVVDEGQILDFVDDQSFKAVVEDR